MRKPSEIIEDLQNLNLEGNARALIRELQNACGKTEDELKERIIGQMLAESETRDDGTRIIVLDTARSIVRSAGETMRK